MGYIARTAVAICSVMLLTCAASAQGQARLLQRETFTHEVLGRDCATELSFSLLQASPSKAVLNIDMNSSMDGSEGRAALLNTLVGLACSPGLRMSAQPRPYWLNPQSGEYEFLYSKDLPAIPALDGLAPQMQRAVSGGPQQMFAALSELSRALDPAVQPVGPQSPLLGGDDPAYMIGGVSWLLPVSMGFEEIVTLFKEEESLAPATRIRIVVPLELSADAKSPHVLVYVGGLSTAMLKAKLLPQDIPATAIPLAPLPEETADEPLEEDAPADKDAADTEENTDAQEVEVEVADDEAQEEVGAIPQTIPALVYSYRWIGWEGRLELDAAALPETDAQPETDLPAEAPRFEPLDEREAVPAGDGIIEESAAPSGAVPAESAVDFFIPGGARGDSIEVESTQTEESSTGTEAIALEVESEDEAALEEDNRAQDNREDEGASVEVGDGGESVAKAVEPGTIPDFDSEFVIPLKPITNPAPQGGSGMRQPISSGTLGGAPTYSAPPDLGEMILIPEGHFLLGTGQSAQDSEEDEHPQQQLYLPDFYIDKYLVTNRQFYEFALASGYKPDGQWERYFSPATADLPVRGVSFKDASAYARWAGKRLPTEVEWEKAMRGTDGRTYPWGEEWSASILPRGEFNYDVVMAAEAASPYGLLSTVGVLWQWTSSSFAPYPYDPNVKNQYKVLRGGCFSNGRNVVRCANRYSEGETVALNTFGFRCAKDA